MYDQVKFISGGKFISRGEWLHPRRTIDSHELIFVLCGTVNIFLGNREYRLVPGDVLHIWPGCLHGGTEPSDMPVSFYWMHFTGVGSFDPLPEVLSHPESGSQSEILCKQLLHCVNTVGYPSECADYYIRILLMELLIQRPATNALCAAVEEWIRVNCDRSIRVVDVSEHFGFNSDYLSRVFRKYHPEGLKSYMDAAKCLKIKQDLAATDLTLREIAHKYGFGDYKYFLKYFRTNEGVTPTQYRKAYCNTHTNWK